MRVDVAPVGCKAGKGKEGLGLLGFAYLVREREKETVKVQAQTYACSLGQTYFSVVFSILFAISQLEVAFERL